ncbi:type II secretion system ATPase GspE [Telmatospirillum siberiense]|uniref:Type II secretion system protein E n=1 Tax=Telmatospirillum siberiense TaxID=382514 RepID=A0A2N3PQB9_9PROT|nr:type II secretion system ATPase GspE [Telmatospirillum siberiense]PKU22599.1 type II secretion system protein GspE [Telmatospirillum siberiense]
MTVDIPPSFPAPAATSPEAAMDALAEVIMERGLVDARTLERARRVAEDTGRRLDGVLIQLGLASERGLAEAYAALLGLPLATADRFPEDPVLSERLKPKFLRHAHVVPLTCDGDGVIVAMTDPFDQFTRQSIAAAVGKPVRIEVAVPIDLEAALDRLYPDWSEGKPQADEDDAGETTPIEEDAERLKDLASEAPVIRLVNQIIARAVETQASDIHIEPFENALRVRYRYDGVLHEAEAPPAHLTAAIISRIKIMARLDIAERRLPQDGRIKLAVRGQEVDFRVSTIPSLHGETVVLRVLDRNAVEFDFGKLGMSPQATDRFTAALDQPNGIVLVTGPTGSGKTTTLYTGLLRLNTVVRKIVTVEDPIEYQLAGINQIQVKPQIGLTFATLLRSILRQDPDVIMVGEIRDLETAQIAAQAALTGHLVLSTLHTNSAASTITRLRDMGLEDYLITAVLRGILAQRLVRRLCPQCRRETPASAELVERFGLSRLAPEPYTLFHPVGCPHCRGTGFKGRMAIAEFLLLDEPVERLIFERADHTAIEQAAIALGMRPMFDAGLAAALAGETTIEEVTRSIRMDG